VGAAGIASDADLEPLLSTPPQGTDPRLLRQLRYMFEAGGWVLLESAIADLPTDLRWLLESDAVTIPQLGTLHAALGVTSAADLHEALRCGAIRPLAGLGDVAEAAIARVLPSLRASLPRVPLGRALSMAEPMLEQLRALPEVAWAEPSGSLRRGQDTVGDIEIIAPTTAPEAALDALVEGFPDARCLHRSSEQLHLRFERIQVGVRCPDPARAGAVLLNMTGAPAHLQQLRALATGLGHDLAWDGLLPSGATARLARTEHEIYAALGLPWIPPEIRHGDDEVVRARSELLPPLLSGGDLRGDLHMHTEYSDGRDTVAAMVEAALALGYEYMAVTDHSPHSSASRNLSADSVDRQADEIAGLRDRFPGIAILHGCEVDILAEGRLDFPDRILERFDIVLASLHERLGDSPVRLLSRYVAAMRHPLVNVITHPSNRLVPHREGYELDFEGLFAEALATGTAVEVDGAPVHLDMDGALARRAVAAGVTIVVNSDAHRAEMLGWQMRLGLTTARRGWVEARHVLNTRPLADVRAFVAAKRAR
jgi:DNA polymerase (family 10)